VLPEITRIAGRGDFILEKYYIIQWFDKFYEPQDAFIPKDFGGSSDENGRP
jgi:hypothetical protein